MQSIIFYGAGQNLRDNFRRWYDNGLHPVCIVDANASLHHTMFNAGPGREGGIEILPLLEAIERYSDYLIYPTLAPSNLIQVVNYLQETGVPRNKICFFDDMEVRKGCPYLGNAMLILPTGISACCNLTYATYIKLRDEIVTEDTLQYGIEDYLAWVEKTLDAARNDRVNDCTGCYMYQDGIYPKTAAVDYVIVGNGFKGDSLCNCNCIYCMPKKSSWSGRGEQVLNMFDVYRAAFNKLGKAIKRISISDGEIAIQPYKKDLIDMALENRWIPDALFTNAIKYDEDVAELFRQNGGLLSVSLDAGTRKTYKQVKQVDAFDQVALNIAKYAEAGAFVLLKYILLPGINDNEPDYDGFIKVAKSINCDKICIEVSYDFQNKRNDEEQFAYTDISESVYRKFEDFITRVQDAGLHVTIRSEYFTTADCEKLNKLLFLR